MLLFGPSSTDVLFPKFPRVNVGIIACTVLVFFYQGVNYTGQGWAQYILDGWHWQGMLGHMFLHSGFWHIFGNMLFLWVFGNAICTKLSDLGYLCLYLLGGLAAASTHLLLDGGPAVGASGAINAIVGFYLVVYPLNKVRCFYFIFWVLPPICKAGQFRVPGWLMIGIFFAFDIWGALRGGAGVAYWAHIGGFACGFTFGMVAVMLDRVKLTKHDFGTLWDLCRGRTRQPASRGGRHLRPARTDESKVYVVDID